MATLTDITAIAEWGNKGDGFMLAQLPINKYKCSVSW